MDKFAAYKLEFQCEATTLLALPRNTGSMLRGAFFAALRRSFCLNRVLPSCLPCPTAAMCPICKLVATVDRENDRGAEVPRPFALEPTLTVTGPSVSPSPNLHTRKRVPGGGGTLLSLPRWEGLREGETSAQTATPWLRRYAPGSTFSFGITLFGQALLLFPYVILAVQQMGEAGLGDRNPEPGRFRIAAARVVNPLTGVDQPLYTSGEKLVHVPEIAISHRDVLAHAAGLPADGVTLELLTPLRLVVNGALVQQLTFASLVQRLLRRLTDLYRHCCGEDLDTDFSGLLESAKAVRVGRDQTRWLDLSSYSSRRRATTPVGGLIGSISFTGDLGPFLPFLVWGEITHLGKDTTRGNGWYRIAGNSSWTGSESSSGNTPSASK